MRWDLTPRQADEVIAALTKARAAVDRPTDRVKLEVDTEFFGNAEFRTGCVDRGIIGAEGWVRGLVRRV